MNRYFSSFLLSAFIYMSFLIGSIYFVSSDDKVVKKLNENDELIKFTIVNKIEEIVTEKEKVIVKKIEAKKIVPKRLKIKKVITKTQKKIVALVKEKIIKKVKKVSKTPIIKEKKITKNKTIKIKNIVKKPKKTISQDDVKKRNLQINAYYSKVKAKINSNKTYPRKAVRRGIEGLVKVNVRISAKGELLSYKILEGKKVFRNSIIKSIKKSFPIVPLPNTFTKSMDLSFFVKYTLY